MNCLDVIFHVQHKRSRKVVKGTVVLVPGWLGSALLTAPADTPWYAGQVLWVDAVRLGTGGWRYLQLAPDGRSNALPGAQPLIPGGAILPYWGTLRQDLADLGWSTWAPALDWRGTTADDAARLVTLLEQLRELAPVQLLAHSRGGLVVRAALATLRHRGELDLVGRVVGLGVPHTGSVEALSVLAGWQAAQLGVSFLTQRIDSYWWPAWRSGGWEAVTASWPSLYALLPAPQAGWISPDQARRIYDPPEWSAINRIIAPAWLTAAQIGWATLPPPDPAVPWLDLYGDADATLVSWSGPGLPADRQAGVWAVAGDGVVPTASATWPGHAAVRTGLSHPELATARSTAVAADQWFRGITPAAAEAPPAKAG